MLTYCGWFSFLWAVFFLYGLFVSPLAFLVCWGLASAWMMSSIGNMDCYIYDESIGSNIVINTIFFSLMGLPVCAYWFFKIYCNGEPIKKLNLYLDTNRILRKQEKFKSDNIIAKISKEINNLEKIKKRINYEIEIYNNKNIYNAENIQKELQVNFKNVNFDQEVLKRKVSEISRLSKNSVVNSTALNKYQNEKTKLEEIITEANNVINAEKEIPTMTH